jgi:hypothetical protein
MPSAVQKPARLRRLCLQPDGDARCLESRSGYMFGQYTEQCNAEEACYSALKIHQVMLHQAPPQALTNTHASSGAS